MIFLFFAVGNSQAQERSPSFRNFNTENGLPSSEVYASLQDKQGNMWFATDHGVSKYNGNEFRTYTTKDGLTDNTVFKLFEDHKGRIWMFSYSGRLFYFDNGKIYPFKYNEALSVEIDNKIPYGIFVDTTENIYLSILRWGILKFTPDGKAEWLYKLDKNHYDNYVVKEFLENGLLFSTIGDSMTEKKSTLVYDNGKNAVKFKLSGLVIGGRSCAIKASPHEIFVSILRTLYRIKDGLSDSLASLPGEILSICKDKNGNLWVGGEDGIYFYERSNFSLPPRHYLQKSSVSGITQDHEGGFWFTTIESGVYYMPRYEIGNFYFKEDYLQRPVSLISDGTSLYAGFWNGSILKINGNSFKEILPHNDSLPMPIYNLTFFPNEDRIYVSSYRPGYISKDKFHAFKTGQPLSAVTKFLLRSEGKYCTATSSSFLNVFKDSIFVRKETSLIINCLIETPDQDLILGCNSGALIYNDKKDEFKPYRSSLRNVRIDDMKWLGNYLVFATKGKGVLVEKNDSIYKIDESRGLSSNLVHRILIKGNDIWCATNNGISLIHFNNIEKMDYVVTGIQKSGGLINDEVIDIAHLNGTVYVATKVGISFFSSSIDFNDNTPPPVHLSSMYVGGKEVKLSDKLILGYDKNDLRIKYNGISFQSSDKIIFKYLLTNGKDTISSLTKNREVEFLSLQPGDYTFEVSARNYSGVWSKSPAGFSFTIKPVWWQTWWFRILAALLVSVIVYFIYMNRIRSLRHEFEVEKRQANLHLTALRSQMNPHFIFNVMNSIRSFMQRNDLKSAEKYLISFSKLVRYTLDTSDVQEISLAEELSALRNYTELEMQRFENGFDFEIQCEDDIDKDETMLPSLLLQPFVENSIKHGIGSLERGGKILIQISRRKDKIIVSIIDNGRGMGSKPGGDKDEKHVSHGQLITFERINAYNRAYNRNIKARVFDLSSVDGKTTGTRVEVEI